MLASHPSSSLSFFRLPHPVRAPSGLPGAYHLAMNSIAHRRSPVNGSDEDGQDRQSLLLCEFDLHGVSTRRSSGSILLQSSQTPRSLQTCGQQRD
eukprot:767529-Hanusia_phi.AAC.5